VDGSTQFKLLESSDNFLRYEILQKATEVDPSQFSEIFRLLEAHQKELMLADLQLGHGSVARALQIAQEPNPPRKSQSCIGELTSPGPRLERFVACDMGSRVVSDSVLSDSELGDMTIELETTQG